MRKGEMKMRSGKVKVKRHSPYERPSNPQHKPVVHYIWPEGLDSPDSGQLEAPLVKWFVPSYDSDQEMEASPLGWADATRGKRDVLSWFGVGNPPPSPDDGVEVEKTEEHDDGGVGDPPPSPNDGAEVKEAEEHEGSDEDDTSVLDDASVMSTESVGAEEELAGGVDDRPIAPVAGSVRFWNAVVLNRGK